ncbi:uncharacterized protein LOC143236459 [Tachypleus tridentatus]|uniref:uncharacterized protein LOC143236459 n=1 Tax=Tachypleus tridentatus TaxID=6853 RepID=UPI003FCEF1DC
MDSAEADIHRKRELYHAVLECNATNVRKLLDEGVSPHFVKEDRESLLHVLACHRPFVDEKPNKAFDKCRQEIVFMLTDAGAGTEIRDNANHTPLFYALEGKDHTLCDALLQCGADMHALDEGGITLVEEVYRLYQVDRSSREDIVLLQVFEKYFPGLWRAVSLGNIEDVRRLINLWCKTDLHRDGKSLRDLALESGHEEVIGLIINIEFSMRLVHHVLAGNVLGVQHMLTNHRNKLQLDLRNLSARGAPILYFVLQKKDAEMVRLFVDHGCRIYTMMRDQDDYEMPVLFVALQDDMPLSVIQALLPEGRSVRLEELLSKLLHKGKSVLEVAVLNSVKPEVFELLVSRGGPTLVSDRNQDNYTVRDQALKVGKKVYAKIIDKYVTQWIKYPKKFPEKRKILALRGYDHLLDVCPENGPTEDPSLSIFAQKITIYQNQIAKLADAVERGDPTDFSELCMFERSSNLLEPNICWGGRPKGDGLPLLHRAVLHNHELIVNAILLHKPSEESVDSLFDQYHRTALHYAYGMTEAGPIRRKLLDHGCSEHVLDKNGMEPIDFAEVRGAPLMEALLNRLGKGNAYHTPEPNPWAVSKEMFLYHVPREQHRPNWLVPRTFPPHHKHLHYGLFHHKRFYHSIVNLPFYLYHSWLRPACHACSLQYQPVAYEPVVEEEIDDGEIEEEYGERWNQKYELNHARCSIL